MLRYSTTTQNNTYDNTNSGSTFNEMPMDEA